MSIKNQLKPETKLQECYWKFWEGFNHFTKSNKAFCEEFKVHPFPSIRSYQDYHIGLPFHIVVGINFKLKEIRVGAYFSNLHNYKTWSKERKECLESYINKKLVWKQYKTKGSIFTNTTANFGEQYGWEEAFRTMVNSMIQLKKIFFKI